MQKDKISFRITFEKEDVDFMNAYKKEFGGTVQWFVESAVRTKIDQFKIEQELIEFGKINKTEDNAI